MKLVNICNKCGRPASHRVALVIEQDANGSKVVGRPCDGPIHDLADLAMFMRDALHRIAFEEYGPLDSSHTDILKAMTDDARETLRIVQQ